MLLRQELSWLSLGYTKRIGIRFFEGMESFGVAQNKTTLPVRHLSGLQTRLYHTFKAARCIEAHSNYGYVVQLYKGLYQRGY